MSNKRGSGFVFVAVALFLLSGISISMFSFPDFSGKITGNAVASADYQQATTSVPLSSDGVVLTASYQDFIFPSLISKPLSVSVTAAHFSGTGTGSCTVYYRRVYSDNSVSSPDDTFGVGKVGASAVTNTETVSTSKSLSKIQIKTSSGCKNLVKVSAVSVNNHPSYSLVLPIDSNGVVLSGSANPATFSLSKGMSIRSLDIVGQKIGGTSSSCTIYYKLYTGANNYFNSGSESFPASLTTKTSTEASFTDTTKIDFYASGNCIGNVKLLGVTLKGYYPDGQDVGVTTDPNDNPGNGYTCTPATCSSLGKTCGNWPDSCGGTLNCGVCVSSNPLAAYFGPSHTQIVSQGSWSNNNMYYDYILPNSMNASEFNISLQKKTSGSCKLNFTFINSTGSIRVINPLGLRFNQANVLQGTKIILSSLNNTIPYRELKTFRVSSSECNLFNSVEFGSLSIYGQYNLGLTNQTLIDNAQGVIINSPNYNLSLYVPLEVEQIDMSLSLVSQNSNCAFNVLTASNVSGQKQYTLIGTNSSANLFVNRAIALSFNLMNPKQNIEIKLNSTNNCSVNLLNITKLIARGRITSGSFIPCTGNTTRRCGGRNIVTSVCNIVTGVLTDVPLSQQEVCVDCATKCNTNGVISSPNLRSSADSCKYRGKCNNNFTIYSTGAEAYDMIWRYNYYEGDPVEICACDGNSSSRGQLVRVPAYSDVDYNVDVNINDANNRIISSIDLVVFASKGENRSSPLTISVTNISYPCNNECDVLGKKYEVIDNNPSNYQVCERKSANSVCFKRGKKQQCNYAQIFDASLSKCVNTQGQGNFNCNDDNNPGKFFCNFSAITTTNASNFSSRSCGVAGISCFKCDNNFKYNETEEGGYCVSNNCINNNADKLCANNGGICSKIGIVNATVNDSLDCCNGDVSCFKCENGFHIFNNTCISNECAGDIIGENFNIGAHNTTNNSVNMNWTYKKEGRLGACEWNCSARYELNVSSGNSCQLINTVPCNSSSLNGICLSSTSFAEAHIDNIRGECPADKTCFVCNDNATLRNGRCEIKTCADYGLINNGFDCVNSVDNCAGCVILKGGSEKCVGNDPTKIVRVNVDGTKYFCNYSSNKFVPLILTNLSCQSNAQCESNFCGSGRCLDIVEEVNRATTLYSKMLCGMLNIGDIQGYRACLASRGITGD